MPPPDAHFIPPHGGYEQLRSYQKAVIVYVGTCFFVKKWLPKYGDRTVDQMVQAARSGKQNIVEGSVASGTSKEMEVKLTNVARASLEELKEDYRDFLRTNASRVIRSGGGVLPSAPSCLRDWSCLLQRSSGRIFLLGWGSCVRE